MAAGNPGSSIAADQGMTDDTQSSFLIRHRYGLLFALGFLIYVPFLGLRDLWFPDEPNIAEVCRAMFLSGDWIAPRRMGTIWVDYPPMIYWAGTLFSHLFGTMSAFTLRLPNALAGIATALVTCFAGSRWFGARAGLWAGIVLLTAVQFVYNSVSYRPDVLFTLAITAGMVVYAEGCGTRPRLWMRIAGFALFGAAMLAKGPLGLLLPGLVLTLWHGSRREWRRLLELAPLAVVALGVYLPWFVACAKAMGADSILYELYAQNIARFFSGFRGHEQPIYYYVVNFWPDLWPWSWLVPFAGWWVLRSEAKRDRNLQLALWWFVAFLLFLSYAVTKRQLYLLPAYPAVALLLGRWFAPLTTGHRSTDEGPDPRPLRFWAAGMAAVFVLLGVAFIAIVAGFNPIVQMADFNPEEMAVANGLRAPLVGTGILLLAMGLWIVSAWRHGRTTLAAVRVGIAHVALYIALLAWVMPPFAPTRTYRPQSLWIREQIGDQSNFGIVFTKNGLGFRKRGAFSYYTGAMVDVLETQDQVEQYFRQYPDTIVLVYEEEAAAIFAGNEESWRSRVLGEFLIEEWVLLAVRGP